MFEKISIISFFCILFFEMNGLGLKKKFGHYFTGTSFKLSLFCISIFYFLIGIFINIQKFIAIEKKETYPLPQFSKDNITQRILNMPDSYPQKKLLHWLNTHTLDSTLYLSEKQIKNCELYKISLIGIGNIKINTIEDAKKIEFLNLNDLTEFKKSKPSDKLCQIKVNSKEYFKNNDLYMISKENYQFIVPKNKIKIS